jgi:mannosyltransferase
MSRAVLAPLALVTAGTLLLRTGVLHSGYWIDEAITVGIASHPLADIPSTLRLDGSPPLFYLLLHGWMTLAGTTEAGTRALALLFALLAVPVAWWAGSAVFGRRAGLLAAAGAAGCPFLMA